MTTASQAPSISATPADLIAGEWRAIPGTTLQSRNPARPTNVIWSGAPNLAHVDAAIAAARAAFATWAAFPQDRRNAVLRRFQTLANARVDALAALIRDEVGKPLWDAKAEASLLANKVDITLDDSATGPFRRVTGFDLNLGGTKSGKAWFKPHGVMAVVGPFNFPAHLPNGHIVPALAMGNTIVFKPSDKAPATGQFLATLFNEALAAENVPPGVFNLVQGGSDIASALVHHDDLDGILFTGSWPVGRRIMQANLDRPGRILALEMGGNNPAVILPDADLKQAVIECVRCAFITAGQRCTCTRRVIVHESIAAKVIPAICKAASELIIGDPAASHPVFMGPVISEAARDAMLQQVATLAKAGAEVLVQPTATDGGTGGWYLTPGVLKEPRFSLANDLEIFGPVLRISTTPSLDDAIAQANATNFGLAASIFTKDPAGIERFLRECRAGCINVNTGTAGASSKLPFGGLGHSGNHRPAGAFSLDYCAYPVAGMLESGDASTISPGMRFDEGWLA
jgi:succinylglutamic semialdehyde dehydrogenase